MFIQSYSGCVGFNVYPKFYSGYVGFNVYPKLLRLHVMAFVALPSTTQRLV